MAKVRQYGYIIKGRHIALVEKDTSFDNDVNFITFLNMNLFSACAFGSYVINDASIFDFLTFSFIIFI